MIAGDWVPGTCSGSLSVTSWPFGSVPVAVARFRTVPASRSACVTEYVAVHVRTSPGASVTGASRSQSSADRPGSGSVITTSVSVTLPMFVAVKV